MLLLALLAAAPLSLPLDSTKFSAGGAPATVEELEALKLDTIPGIEGAPLRELKLPLEEGSVVRVLGMARSGAFTLHLVRLDEEAAMMSVSMLFVLVKNAKGAWVGSALLGASSSSEAGGAEEKGTLTADGTLTRRKVLRVPMHEDQLPTELVSTSEARGRLGADGRITVTEAFVSRDGSFIDEKSKEELRVFGEKVFYRSNETKPFQLLLREKDDVRFKAGAKPYKLTWSDDLRSIACTGPDGKPQRFTREW